VTELRVLSVRQPYAGAIIWFGKDRENRPRRMNYRGPLLIHASLPEPVWGEFLTVRDTAALPPEWTDARRARGAVLGEVTVTGCHHADDCFQGWKVPRRERYCSPWAQLGKFHIELSEARPLLEPVPCKGKLGLWRLPEDVEKAVREQLEEVPGD
jgi:hypothetical protein